MRFVLVLLGILWILAGVFFFFFTDSSKEVLRNFLKKKNIKVLSILPLAIGVVLIAGSAGMRERWIAITIGVLGILKGLFFVFGPEKKTKPLIDWWLNTSGNAYKSWGVAFFLLGVLLLYLL